MDIERIVKEYCEQLFPHKRDNLDNIHQFFDTIYQNSHKEK